MLYRALSYTELQVSVLCLGTMTWGEQNTEQQAHQQMDLATAAGINFFDTAEMYPVPPQGETQGRTETYIGNWLRKHGRRNEIILASKVTGPTQSMSYLRNGPRLNRAHIEAAINASLQRLQTDYIDLYQVHWPERSTNFFGRLGYSHAPSEDEVPIEETLCALNDLVREGKVRYIGVSNETPWGVNRYIDAAATQGYPRIVSIQNPYSLLNRSFEIGLAEIALREAVGLLAYSPLGFGVLSGKYLDGANPEGARLSRYERFDRYSNFEAATATQAYVELARAHQISPVHMALAYVNSRPFVTSNIIGATSISQLEENLSSVHIRLSEELLAGIEAIHQRQPNPAP